MSRLSAQRDPSVKRFAIGAAIAAALLGFGLGAWVMSGQSDNAPRARAEASHDDESVPHRIKLSAQQIDSAGIKIQTASADVVRETLSVYGLVAPNAERTREVAARFPGTIRSVAKRIGDAVKQGETLATVESNESLQTYSVPAPISGVVIARNSNPGEQTRDKVLFTIADLETVWVELSLFPRDVAKVSVGQRVRIKNVDADLAAEGQIVYVAPFSATANQTRTARVLLDNSDQRWAPGLYVTAEVVLAESPVAVVVSNAALQTVDGRSVVFVQTDEGFEPQPVKLGRSDEEHTEVLDGMTEGTKYATQNSFILKAELGKGEAAHED